MDRDYAGYGSKAALNQNAVKPVSEITLGDVLNEAITGLHQMYDRLESIADKIHGSIPRPADGNAISPIGPSLVSQAHEIVNLINACHAARSRIETGL